MKRHSRNVLMVIIVALLATGWVLYLTRPTAIDVSVGVLKTGRVEATVANTRAGTIKACRRAKLAPAIGGQIAELLVHRGERVKAGQVLLTLWNKDLTAQIDLAQSEAETARSHVKEVCLVAESAQHEAERLLKLRDRQLVAIEAVDRVVTEADAKRESCATARSNVNTGEDRIAAARASLERTILTAPFDGVVAEVNGEVGEFVTPSPPGIPTLPAIDLIDDSCIYVTAPIDEVDAPAIVPGRKTRITLDAMPDISFPGVVRRVASYVMDLEKQARTVDVDVEFDDPEQAREMLAGYSADIEVILQVRDDVLRVPTEAVLEGHRVLLYDADKKRLKERSFKPGLSNWQYTEVLEGLQVGDVIVTSVGRTGVETGVRAEPEEIKKPNNTKPAS